MGNEPSGDFVLYEKGNHALSKEVTFQVFEDGDSGVLCASGVDHAIHTHASSWDRLMENIHEAVECHFEVPYSQVKITLVEATDVEAREGRDVGPHCD